MSLEPIRESLKEIYPQPISPLKHTSNNLLHPSLLEPWREAECLVCRDIGWVLSKAEDKAIPCPACSRWEERKRQLSLEYSGIPSPRRINNFTSFKLLPGTKPAYEAAKGLAEGLVDFKLLLIYGSLGNGKTHLAYAAGLSVATRGLSVLFKPCADWFSEMKRAMSKLSLQSVDEIMAELKAIDFLILDDIGINYNSDWEQEKLDEVVNSRYAQEKYLLATTNLTPDKLSSRVRSRFSDTRIARMVLNDGADFRLRK